LQVSLIPTDKVDLAWPLIHARLDQIPDMPTQHAHLLNSLKKGTRRAIIVWTESSVDAVAIIQVAQRPVRQLLVWAMAGDGLVDWRVPLQATLVDIAKELKLPRIRGYGRRGWTRALKDLGWEEVSTVCEYKVELDG
jgi:hypothetical protein